MMGRRVLLPQPVNVTQNQSRNRWILKGCPQCGGDLYHDLLDGAKPQCFQCGRSTDIIEGGSLYHILRSVNPEKTSPRITGMGLRL